jgi:hypothetical protein
MAAGTSSSIGAGADLPIFSGDIDLCEAHEKTEEAMAGHCVWMDSFIPINVRRNASSISTMASPFQWCVLWNLRTLSRPSGWYV